MERARRLKPVRATGVLRVPNPEKMFNSLARNANICNAGWSVDGMRRDCEGTGKAYQSRGSHIESSVQRVQGRVQVAEGMDEG
jgi:hypothetical protein